MVGSGTTLDGALRASMRRWLGSIVRLPPLSSDRHRSREASDRSFLITTCFDVFSVIVRSTYLLRVPYMSNRGLDASLSETMLIHNAPGLLPKLTLGTEVPGSRGATDRAHGRVWAALSSGAVGLKGSQLKTGDGSEVQIEERGKTPIHPSILTGFFVWMDVACSLGWTTR